MPQSLYESRQRHIFGIAYEISIRVLLACTFPEAYIIRDGYERSQERVVVASASSIFIAPLPASFNSIPRLNNRRTAPSRSAGP